MPAYPTLLDVTQSLDPNGAPRALAELLNQTNEILSVLPVMEGNKTDGHTSGVRTGIPAPTWRAFYEGVQPTKSTRATVTDTIGMMEAYAEVDVALADLANNAQAFRASEDRAIVEGMSQEMAQVLVYGNRASNPRYFNGLTPRFNDLSAGNGSHVIPGGGVGTDNASIWLVVFGPETVFGIYPKGSQQAGLSVRDLGEVTIENIDGSNGRMQAYRTHFRWDLGLVVKDWRACVRICNIDRSLLKADKTTGADLHDLLHTATETIEGLDMGQPAFLMDRTLRTMLRKQDSTAIANSTLGTMELGGTKRTTFNEIPILRVDRLNVDEALVS